MARGVRRSLDHVELACSPRTWPDVRDVDGEPEILHGVLQRRVEIARASVERAVHRRRLVRRALRVVVRRRERGPHDDRFVGFVGDRRWWRRRFDDGARICVRVDCLRVHRVVRARVVDVLGARDARDRQHPRHDERCDVTSGGAHGRSRRRHRQRRPNGVVPDVSSSPGKISICMSSETSSACSSCLACRSSRDV